MRQTISAIIPAKNEEKNIKRCLQSVKWCDTVLVISTGDDDTAKIAKEMGAEVISKPKTQTDNFVTVQEHINWGIDHVKTDWVMRIDADEEVTEDLKKEITSILEHPTECVAYDLRRNQYFLGAFLKGGDWAYDRLVRLFRKNAAKYDLSAHVHEQLQVEGAIGHLKEPLNHFSHPDMRTLVRKFQTYTTIQVQDMNLSSAHALYNLLIQPPYIFLRWMIWHHGYRDGLRGLVAGMFRGWYEFLLYKKYIVYKHMG